MTEAPSSTCKEIDPILLKAIDWMVLLESGLASIEDHENFQIWLNQSPHHLRAWQELQQGVDQPFQQLQQHSLDANLPVHAVTQSVLQANKQRIRRGIKGGSVLILLFGLGVFIWLQQTRPSSFIQADYYTRTAEQKQIQLEDGSQITLAAYSAIKVDYSQHKRDIYLLDGALIANVSADRQRPFIVHTQQAQMQALGTEFMVSQHTDYSDLAVVEHTVKVSNSHQFKVVPQGHSVRVNSYQIQDLPVDASNLASWKDGILQVEDMPLSALIELIKPYHHGAIYLNNYVKSIKVYGVFYLDDPDKILDVLQATQPIHIYKKLGLVYISRQDQKSTQ
ncbi:FecR family protein [Acinetobacter ursingii]|uniref:FecR family protein n=1 Tax=Acinetobacter ursingii TaxID=108980 RepID=A0AA46NV93_9GAMM|nr:FecR family protein [Acinetobacter ursingii]MCU4603449.1 FecR family protein [Acinetobacter ursingii]MDH2020302.1 FecR family protein [Acinetobacter ursingii]MDH2072598.1 FecR family protein [Acinetobacter ursingii]UYF76507.1 FecR family protein [Acinetobacter ursingii]